MPRGRKKTAEKADNKMNYECCGGRNSGKILACGLALILLGLLLRAGWSVADLLLLVGAIFVVKGLIVSMVKK